MHIINNNNTTYNNNIANNTDITYNRLSIILNNKVSDSQKLISYCNTEISVCSRKI